MKDHKEHIEPTKENVQTILDKVAEFAQEKGYTVRGELELKGKLKFPSQNQKKVLRNYLTRLNWKVTRSQVNRFLHALKRFTPAFKASIELSDREIAIQKARKEWKEARDKAEILLKKYKEIKGDFYKKLEATTNKENPILTSR